jgi:hypothetical protein
MDMPPSRYRVVERGRRLIVIDRQTGAPASGLPPADQRRIDVLADRLRMPEPGRSPDLAPPPRSEPQAAMRGLRASAARSDPNTLHTAAWYDEKGPRAIPLSPEGKQKLQSMGIASVVVLIIFAFSLYFFWPVLFVIGFAAMRKEARAALRKGVTRVLDTINQS